MAAVTITPPPTNLRQFLHQKVSVRAGDRGLVGTVVEVGKDYIKVYNEKIQTTYQLPRDEIVGITKWTTP